MVAFFSKLPLLLFAAQASCEKDAIEKGGYNRPVLPSDTSLVVKQDSCSSIVYAFPSPYICLPPAPPLVLSSHHPPHSYFSLLLFDSCRPHFIYSLLHRLLPFALLLQPTCRRRDNRLHSITVPKICRLPPQQPKFSFYLPVQQIQERKEELKGRRTTIGTMCHYVIYQFFCGCQYRLFARRCADPSCRKPTSYAKKTIALVCDCPGHGGPPTPHHYERMESPVLRMGVCDKLV